MRKKYGLPVLAGVLVAILTSTTSSLHAEPYELSKNDVMESKEISSSTVSLFGVKLGDSEAKALEVLVNEKIAGIKAEQEAAFIFLISQSTEGAKRITRRN